MSYAPLAGLPGIGVAVDTCRSYALVHDGVADLVDLGAAGGIEALLAPGSTRLGSLVLTHHHRDQLQGLARLDAAVQPREVLVPETEVHLVGPGLRRHLVGREVFTNYNTREDRFSVLDPVPGVLPLRDHDRITLGGTEFAVVPTPGHTTGAITLLGTVDGVRVAFVGDLLSGPGTLPSLRATEWAYGGSEGLIATVASCALLQRLAPDVLLPAHGEPVLDPGSALALLTERLLELLALRNDPPALWTQRGSVNSSLKHGRVHEIDVPATGTSPHLLREFIAEPFERISDHLLVNRTASGNTHVLLSETGNALFFDFGYDAFLWPDPDGYDRAKVRTWLYTLDALKEQFGVTKVEVAIPTHYHDDHVASMGVLQRREGTELWIPETMSVPLGAPGDHDLPCLWFEPIVADRLLPDDGAVRWHEHEIEVWPFPGHTLYASAYAFTVDGTRVLNVGDQYRPDGNGDLLTPAYVYKNGFRRRDFADTARRVADYAPELVLSGHWAPYYAEASYFDALVSIGDRLAAVHDELLGPESPEANAAFFLRVDPFTQRVRAGEPARVELRVENPWDRPLRVEAVLACESQWWPPMAPVEAWIAPNKEGRLALELPPVPASLQGRLLRFAVDVTVDSQPLGQAVDGTLDVG